MAHRAATLTLLALTTPLTLEAAQETQISAQLHGSVALEIGGDFHAAVLREQGIDVGNMSSSQSDFTTTLRFGVLPGLEFGLTLPVQLSGSLSYSDVSPMIPCTDDEVQPDACLYGTSAGTTLVLGVDSNGSPAWAANPPDATAVAPSYSIHGAEELVLGLRYAPFSEKYLGRQKRDVGRLRPKATLVLEGGLAIPVGPAFYERTDGAQGAADGKLSAQFGAAMSTRTAHSEPYVSFLYRSHAAYDVFLPEDPSAAVTLDPPDELHFYTGIELLPYEEDRLGSRFSVDVAGGWRLYTRGVWPSGIYLPSVLTTGEDATQGEPVVIDERVGWGGRLRLHYQIVRYVSLHVGGDVFYYLPQRAEHPYPIRYGRDLSAGFAAGLTAHF